MNLHVFFEENHPEVELNLLFRNYLRKHPDVRDEYSAIKIKILQNDSAQKKVGKLSFPVYTLRKGKFINQAIKKTGFNRLRILKCTTDDELEAARSIRQKYFFDQQKIKDPYLQDFEDPNHEHILLYHGAKIIGYADIRLWQKSKIAALRIIAIVDSYQNNGFGSFFLTIIEKWLKVLDYEILYVKLYPGGAVFFFSLWNGYQKMSFDDSDEYKSDLPDDPTDESNSPIREILTYLWRTSIEKILGESYSSNHHHSIPVGKYLKAPDLRTPICGNDLVEKEMELRK